MDFSLQVMAEQVFIGVVLLRIYNFRLIELS